MYTLEDLKKDPVFKNFIELTKIPRPSYHEKEVSDYLVSWAKEKGLEVIQDEALNVIIKRKASEGYEDKSPVIIQGHMDMVPEKSVTSDHDFIKDPLKLRIIDDNLYATDTTLGADNGIAVAMAMAVLEDETIKSPALEVLVTSAEEVGMDGAIALEPKNLDGKRLLNIDSEEEGIFFVSCAGGNVCHVSFTPNYEDYKGDGYKIHISGFIGGHSGMEIIKQRGNAIKVMGRLLNALPIDRISSIKGGAKHNAISRSSEAVVTLKSGEEDKVKAIIENLLNDVKGEYSEDKPEITFEKVEVEKVMDEKTSKNLISYMTVMPDGVISRMMDMENMVESSLNVGVLEENEGKLTFVHAVRSSRKSSKYAISNSLKALSELVGAEFKSFSDYPEWQYDPNSELKEKSVEVYEKLTGKKPLVKAIHAGLECGILKEKLPETEMISFGPNMADVHTPNEHLSIESTKRTFQFLKNLLSQL